MSSRKRHWLLILFSFGAACLAGCSIDGISERFKAKDEVSKTFNAQVTPHVVVDTFNGEVAVTIGPSGQARAKVTKWGTGANQEAAEDSLVGIDVTMTQEGDKIRIVAKAPQPLLLGSRGADVTLEVPAGAVLDLRTSNGKIAATGKTGDVTANSSNGPIDVTGSQAKLQLSTSNGKISVAGGAGKMELKTSNGGIDIKSEQAVVTADSSNGAITFTGSLADGEHSFRTHNGKIALTLPADARFRLEAETRNGQIKSEFTVDKTEKTRKNRLYGKVGAKPAATIKVQTSNGGIEIHRATP
jgi:hypothetical protein